MEKKFNLIDEKWILVRDEDCNVFEVSLKDALLNSHKYTGLSGELPTQDIAILRVLLALLHTVFSRVDVDGNPIELEDADAAFEQWKSIIACGRIPEKPITDYFEQWYDRFWLLHPERPFWQVSDLSRGTEYDSSKLNGEISESSNKKRMFSKYSFEGKQKLSFSQAARWIVHLNGYDDTSSKPTKEGASNGKLPSPGAGWLGKLGLTIISGTSLFETLMYNLVMVRNGEPENNEKPVWEKEKVSAAERVEIPFPDNLAELYTIQSRRLLLTTDDDSVTGYKLIGGDFFTKENSFIEPMTIWNLPKKETEPFTPRRHDESKQLWREFSTFFPDDSRKTAEVILWYRNYVSKCLPKSHVLRTMIASVQYGDKDFFVDNVYSDSLSLSAGILTEIGKAWRQRIKEEIEKCDELAKKVFSFAMNVHIAQGGSGEDTAVGSSAKAQFYFKIDVPFRKWLESIDPYDEDVQGKLNEWDKTILQITFSLADEISASCSPDSIAGVFRDERIYSVPKAYNILRSNAYKIYCQN